MGKWYIDRSRNISSIISSIHYDLLKRLINSKSEFIDPNDLIDELQIDGANKNALLTNFRDLGLIDENNKPSSFFCACCESIISVSTTVLLILLKRNDEKKYKNSVKPFVVIAKALSEMIHHECEPILSWGICNDYLMTVSSYNDIIWDDLERAIKNNSQINSTPVLDIWFNALISTGLFDGDKKYLVLKKEYYEFIEFVANYGHEMKPSQSREEYLAQACDAEYGWYELFSNHPYEAVCALKTLPQLITYVQAVDALCGFSKDERHNCDIPQNPASNKHQLEDELHYLERQYANIGERIEHLKRRLFLIQKNDMFTSIKTNANNESLFLFYLQNNKCLSEHTITSYFAALRKMRDILLQYEHIIINTEIYFVDDAYIIEQLIARFESNTALVAINKDCHNSISAAYNNYLVFLKTMQEIG